jgi:hypothetical protein
VNDLLIQDTFEPYYAGRPGYSAQDLIRRRKPAGKEETGSARDKLEVPENRPKPASPEH